MIAVLFFTLLNAAAIGFIFLMLSTMTPEQKKSFSLYFSIPFFSITLGSIAGQVIALTPIEIIGFWYRGWFIVSTLLATLTFYIRSHRRK